MKVGLYMPLGKDYGGAERRLLRIFKNLCLRSDNFSIVFKGADDIINETVEKEDLKSITIYRAANSYGIFEIIRKNGFGRLWFFNVDKTILALGLISRIYNIDLVMTVANYYYSIGIFPSNKVKYSFNIVASRTSAIDCLYPNGTLYLSSKFRNVPVSTTPTPSTIRGIFKPGQKEKLIVFAGRMIHIKNPSLFLEAIDNIKEFLRIKNYKVLMCGGGKLSSEVEAYISLNDLSDLVEYKGHIDTSSVLPYSSIFVSIQQDDNYPSQSLIEAISSGNYIVLSNVGNSSKMINNEFGTFVELDKISVSKGISDAVQKYEQGKEKIIQETQLFSDKNFDMEKSVDYFYKILMR